ncbi:MAG: hypothetical protein ACE5SW_05040 [Nitrososphaeraceae archaeon]
MSSIQISPVILSIFFIILLFLSFHYDTFVFGVKDDKAKNKDVLQLKVRMNLNNIELQDTDKIKIVAYINGEAKIQYLDIGKDKEKLNKKSLTSTLEFNRTNSIATVGNDEYFVCGYILKGIVPDSYKNLSSIGIYDCDESMTSEDTDEVNARLFSTLGKFQKSTDLTSLNEKENEETDKVSIEIITPIYDQKDVDYLTVIAMVRGEYQIKTINISDELKKTDKKNFDKDKMYIIKVPFDFPRSTELGTIQYGDMYFGCATSEELGPPEKTECEKKYIKDFDKSNTIVTRHEEDFRAGGKFS